MIVTATGHRPPRLGGYDDAAREKVQRFARQEIGRYIAESQRSVSAFNIGMALGFDCACALACIEMGVPYRAYLACAHPEAPWPIPARERYSKLLDRAAAVLIVGSGSYSVKNMQRRNEAMVDDCDGVLALWSGSKGGTANTIAYAMRTKKHVSNVWPLWLEFNQ